MIGNRSLSSTLFITLGFPVFVFCLVFGAFAPNSSLAQEKSVERAIDERPAQNKPVEVEPAPEKLSSAEDETVDPDAESLPPASQVISKYVKAMGGYEVLGSLKSAHMVFKGTSTSGHDLKSEFYQIKGRYYAKVHRDGIVFTRGVWSDGTVSEEGIRNGFAWQQIEGYDLQQKTGDELQEYIRRRTRIVSSPFWEEDFKKIKCIGKTKVRGKNCYQVRFYDHDGREIDRFFDVETGYLLRRRAIETYDGADHDVTREFLVHEKVGDFVVTRQQSITAGDRVDRWTLESFEYDGDVPEDVFEIPETIQNQIDVYKESKK